MIDFPSLPTDSLYKFMALAGIFVAVFLEWILNGRWMALSERMELLQVENAKAMVELRKLNQDIDRTASMDRAEGEPRMEVLLAEAYRHASATAQAKVEFENFTELHSDLKRFEGRARRAMIGACIVAGAGFAFWYLHVQRYQDIILRATADSVVAAHNSPR